jgi:hypothetical protein
MGYTPYGLREVRLYVVGPVWGTGAFRRFGWVIGAKTNDVSSCERVVGWVGCKFSALDVVGLE